MMLWKTYLPPFSWQRTSSTHQMIMLNSNWPEVRWFQTYSLMLTSGLGMYYFKRKLSLKQSRLSERQSVSALSSAQTMSESWPAFCSPSVAATNKSQTITMQL